MKQFTELLPSLDNQTVALTGNRRLAQHLHRQYDDYQRRQGKTVWETADILPWTTWVERCWQQFGEDSRLVLNDFQVQLIWQKIIGDTATGALLQIPETAKSAKEAWDLLKAWNLTITDLLAVADENTITFITWAKAFQQLCHEQEWLDCASLPTELTHVLTRQPFALPKRILLAGFNLLTPQQQRLIAVLRQHADVERIASAAQITAQVVRVALTDTRQEIYHMATWAQQQAQIHPQARIACIVPELSALRDEVERIFSEVFMPAAMLPGNPQPAPLFNISAGKWLANYPLVHDALLALMLNFNEIDSATISELLYSPFLGGGWQEAGTRAMLDLALRRNGSTLHFSLRDTFSLAQQRAAVYHCPLWVSQAKAFLQESKELPAQQLPSQWAEIFKRQLRFLGWPGDRSLNSMEYQVGQRWQRLLNEFASLDWITGRINLATAHRYLQHLANSVLFQPEAVSSSAPVQILGHFEATGLTFTALWVMGLSDRTWPPVLTPNPLLSIPWQRHLKMPKANVEHELQFYSELTRQFAQSASQVIFSHPQQTADYALQPSALITEYPATTAAALNLIIDLPAAMIFKQRSLETRVDDMAPAVTALEKIKGGADILKNQAACPLRAFAKCRLHAHAVPDLQFGLNSQQRGKLVHAALADIWQVISDYSQLQNLAPTELDVIAAEVAAVTLRQLLKKHPFVLTASGQKLEKQRLQYLLQKWLNVEKQRPFFKVLAHEQVQEVSLAGITMQLRLDRIDEIAGRQVIIDYKTGEYINVNDWFGDRPQEPQLPLYAISNNATVDGLLFAQVRAGNMQYKGIVADAELVAGKKVVPHSDWSELMDAWRMRLQQLAQDFTEGKAQVDPKEQEKTCQYCDLQIFCRVRQISSQISLEDNA